VPRKVVVPRALGALLAIALLAAPAAAHAGPSLSVNAGSDPVAGLPNTVHYDYDTAGQPLNLTVIVRPGSGPACQPTPTVDATVVGGGGGAVSLTPTPLPYNGAGFDDLPFTFPSAGAWRLCAWLARTPDDVAATAVGSAEVRPPNASIAVTAQQDQPKAGGSGLNVHVTGTTESPNDVLVTAVPASTNCAPYYEQDSDPLAFSVVPAGTPTRVTGGFDLNFAPDDLLSYRTWRVCTYLQDGVSPAAAVATGSIIVDLLLKPQLLRRPRVKKSGGTLTCDGGRWKARPAQKLTYAWLAGGKPVAGAKGRRLAARKVTGKSVACRVTARNKLGKATATSKAIKT
jgi:hypothetical protein